MSLWSNEARISFCLSVQLPSFRVFLTPPSSLLLLFCLLLGVCVCVHVLSGGTCALGERVSFLREEGLVFVFLSPGEGVCEGPRPP